jgi:hypothetical protein
MDFVCWITPIKKGKTEAVRCYCQSLETDRRMGRSAVNGIPEPVDNAGVRHLTCS